MQDFSAALTQSVRLVLTADADLVQIVGLSLRVTLTAVGLACLFGIPAGAALAVLRFPGRGLLNLLANAAMGLPPVVVGLTLYMLISRAGPLGFLGLLYTPSAMIIAQTILVTPIVVALGRAAVADLVAEYDETLRAMHASRIDRIGTILWEGRPVLMTVALAGMGRAFAEVGAVMIVGGNINHVTRVMTTAIALETSRGELALALALGIVLLGLSLAINATAMALRPAQRTLAHGR